MESVTPIAGALSTYGLYAISAMLLIAVVYLFKQQRELEKELRENLSKYASENARLLEHTTEALKDNSEAFKDFQNTLIELKQTVQLSLERIK